MVGCGATDELEAVCDVCVMSRWVATELFTAALAAV